MKHGVAPAACLARTLVPSRGLTNIISMQTLTCGFVLLLGCPSLFLQFPILADAQKFTHGHEGHEHQVGDNQSDLDARQGIVECPACDDVQEKGGQHRTCDVE